MLSLMRIDGQPIWPFVSQSCKPLIALQEETFAAQSHIAINGVRSPYLTSIFQADWDHNATNTSQYRNANRWVEAPSAPDFPSQVSNPWFATRNMLSASFTVKYNEDVTLWQ